MRRVFFAVLTATAMAVFFSPEAFSQDPVIVHQIPRHGSGWGGGMAFYEGNIYESFVRSTGGARNIYRKSPVDGASLGTIQGPYSQGYHDVAYDSKRNVFWVTCWGGPLMSIPVTGGSAINSYFPDKYTYGVFYDEELDCLWVANHIRKQIMRVNPDNGQVEDVINLNFNWGRNWAYPTGLVRTGDVFWIGTEYEYAHNAAWVVEVYADGDRRGEQGPRALQLPLSRYSNTTGGFDLDDEGFLWVKGGSGTALYQIDIGWTPTGRGGELEWYLPAGATHRFDHYILVANPNQADAEISIQYVGPSGHDGPHFEHTVSANSRFTVKVNDNRPDRQSIGAIIRSLNEVGVIVERSMYGPVGAGPGGWTGGHNTIGLSETSTHWYLAEGATHHFDMFVHVLNTEQDNVNATVYFRDPTDPAWSEQVAKNLDPESVWTVRANDIAPGRTQLSARVEASGQIAVDRTMYFPRGPENWQDGHSTVGLRHSATEWYFAEGATHIFDQYILIANPSDTNAQVLVTFRDQAGQEWPAPIIDVPAGRRHTVNADVWTGTQAQVSARVVSLNNVGVLAERAMYWPKGGPAQWKSGHVTVGVSEPSRRWDLPEGSTLHFDEYVMIFNPSTDRSADVNVNFSDAGGNVTQHTVTVAPMSRTTVNVNSLIPNNTQVSTSVQSSQPVVAERAMYWPRGNWKGGHVTIGYTR